MSTTGALCYVCRAPPRLDPEDAARTGDGEPVHEGCREATESDARYLGVRDGGRFVIYDETDPNAWVASDLAIPTGGCR